MDLSIRRSKCGKACLVLGGHTMIKFITQGKQGLVVGMQPAKEFNREWATQIPISILEGITSYLCVAKRAYKHDAPIINVLWELFMKQYTNEMSLAQLTLCYNKLAVTVNKPERKSFESKTAALAAIEKLDTIIASQTPQQDAAQSRRNTMSEKDVAEKKPRGKGIGARAMQLILEGKTNQEVIDTIKSEIEGANPTNATIAWYKNKLRQEGKLAPSNRKAKAEKTYNADEAEYEAEAEAEDEE